jgi:uncharacterized protein (DUF58 family)
MTEILIVIMAVLVGVAVFTRETFPLVLAYLFAGTYLVGRWWPRHSLANIQIKRNFVDHVFLGEVVPVSIQVINRSLFPAIWLNIRDLHPIDLAETKAFRQVVSLPSRQVLSLAYELKAVRRGYYPIGPMSMESGDLFGWTDTSANEIAPDYLTVYPRVIPLRSLELPSHSPLGTLRHRQPIFEDPTRPVGKRDYQRGDALRRVDWKSSASSGKLQVKIFEPSIDLQVALLLDLNTQDYHAKARFDGPELSIVAAASLASWVIQKRQSVGLHTNGVDLFNTSGSGQSILPHKGQVHLIRILESLARVKSLSNPSESLRDVIRRYRQGIGWGSTLIIMTGSADENLISELLLARQAGLKPFLIVCGWYVDVTIPVQNGKSFGIPVKILHSEDDLRGWQV